MPSLAGAPRPVQARPASNATHAARCDLRRDCTAGPALAGAQRAAFYEALALRRRRAQIAARRALDAGPDRRRPA